MNARAKAVVIIVLFSTVFAFLFYVLDVSVFRPRLYVLGGLIGAFSGFIELPFFVRTFKQRPYSCALIAVQIGIIVSMQIDASIIQTTVLVVISSIFGFWVSALLKS